MEIKICGITKEYEIDKLIEQKVEYAGFVINYPRSKRNNSLEEVEGLLKYIKEKQGNIKTVAVTVSPTLKQIKQIEQLGFDILQVHKDLLPQVLEETRLPIFRAINIGEDADINVEDSEKIIGVLVDAKIPGNGEVFDWNKIKGFDRKNKKFILAGGLNKSNIREGIFKVNPDIVDCSSGVESDNKEIVGKDVKKIEEFVKEVRR